MSYFDFYDIAAYLNNQKTFSERNVAYNAHAYKLEYDLSKKNGKPTTMMRFLCRMLIEDLDFMDYEETENDIDIDTMEMVLREFMEEI